jgi:hypothetical protein
MSKLVQPNTQAAQKGQAVVISPAAERNDLVITQDLFNHFVSPWEQGSVMTNAIKLISYINDTNGDATALLKACAGGKKYTIWFVKELLYTASVADDRVSFLNTALTIIKSGILDLKSTMDFNGPKGTTETVTIESLADRYNLPEVTKAVQETITQDLFNQDVVILAEELACSSADTNKDFVEIAGDSNGE